MVEWKGFVTQAALSIIASGLIFSGINFFYNEFYNKPNIDIQYLVNGKFVSANITNSGRVPANHFTLVIQTPSNITSYKIFSTEDVSVNRTDPRSLRLYMPKFVQGEGSLLAENTLTSKKVDINKFPKYTFYATFDEGSWKYEIQKPLSSSEMFQLFLANYGMILILISSGITLFILLFFKRTRNFIISKIGSFRMTEFDKFIGIYHKEFLVLREGLMRWIFTCRSTVLKDLIRNHHILVQDNRSNKIFSSLLFLKPGEPDYLDKWYEESLKDLSPTSSEKKTEGLSQWSSLNINWKVILFNHIPDLVTIDSVYSKIDRRTELIQEKKLTDNELRILNLEILRLIENALTKIDWKKYTPDYFEDFNRSFSRFVEG